MPTDIQQLLLLVSGNKKFLIAIFIFGLCCGVGGAAAYNYSFKKNGVEVTTSEQKPNLPVIVEISGAVKNPGVYKLDFNSRVGDLLRESGGYQDNAARIWISKNINLAQELSDTQKIYVPFEWDLKSADVLSLATYYGVENNSDVPNQQSMVLSESIPSQLIPQDSVAAIKPTENQNEGFSDAVGDKTNVNTASAEDLDKLNGIGPAYAQRIIDNRPYQGFADFIERSGLNSSTLEKVRDYVSF